MKDRKLALLIFPLLYVILGISCTKEKILQPGNWTFWTRGPIHCKIKIEFISDLNPMPDPIGYINEVSSSAPDCNTPGNFTIPLADLNVNQNNQNLGRIFIVYDSISPSVTNTWYGSIEINSSNWQNCNSTEIVY